MKHFISFCLAFCSIMLAALHFTPTYAGDQPLKTPKEQKFKSYNQATTTQSVIIPVTFSPGSLADRISIPKPAVKYLHVTKNSNAMDLENLKLNGLLYRDLDPDSRI